MNPGDLVEWIDALGAARRGKISMIDDGVIFVEAERINLRGRRVVSTIWFDADEHGRLTVVSGDSNG